MVFVLFFFPVHEIIYSDATPVYLSQNSTNYWIKVSN